MHLPILLRGALDRLQADPGHRDEQEGDHQEGGQELRVDGGRNPRDPVDQGPQAACGPARTPRPGSDRPGQPYRPRQGVLFVSSRNHGPGADLRARPPLPRPEPAPRMASGTTRYRQRTPPARDDTLMIGVGGIGADPTRLYAVFGMHVLNVNAARRDTPSGIARARRPNALRRRCCRSPTSPSTCGPSQRLARSRRPTRPRPSSRLPGSRARPAACRCRADTFSRANSPRSLVTA
mgnify:CR=1 FL=1